MGKIGSCFRGVSTEEKGVSTCKSCKNFGSWMQGLVDQFITAVMQHKKKISDWFTCCPLLEEKISGFLYGNVFELKRKQLSELFTFR